MDEAQIRAVALVAAALMPYPGNKPVYDRADEFAKYIRDGVIGEGDI